MDTAPTPFHRGELQLQQATGVTREAARLIPAIGQEVHRSAAGFIGGQQLAIVATIDDAGQPWCSAVVGAPGAFVVVDPTTVTLDMHHAIVGDATERRAVVGAPVGLLFIDLASRRRYRVNGAVAGTQGRRIVVQVVDAYPNCPKYIHRRALQVTQGETTNAELRAGRHLGAAERTLIGAADTFFVASAGPDGKLDASHRGGPPGFVRVDGDRLWIPDYVGNNLYNTLGNLAVRPAGGLLFVDFHTGDTLQLSGVAAIDLAADDPEVRDTHRAWTFMTTAWQRSSLASQLDAEELDQPKTAGR